MFSAQLRELIPVAKTARIGERALDFGGAGKGGR
jgi:hypothetical protein